jgi:hypothetical protein
MLTFKQRLLCDLDAPITKDMGHSVTLRFSPHIDGLSLEICSLSTDVRDMCTSPPAAHPTEHTTSRGGGPQRNKLRRASLSLPSNLSNGDRVAYGLRPRTKSDARPFPALSRFPTRKLPPPLKLRRYSGSSSGQSSPQSVYSSASFFSSGGSPNSSRSSPPSSHESHQNFSALYPSHPRSHLPRIQVSSLLSDPSSLSYHLEVVQQPLRAAEFSNAPLSRLPITPPIIVRLVINDASGNPVVP